MSSIQDKKLLLRKKHKQLRKAISADNKKTLDGMVLDNALSLPEYKEANTVLIYVSSNIEVDTKAIILDALSKKKTVAVPKCIDNSCEMDFYCIESFDDLAVQTFSILEPITDRCRRLTSIPYDAVCIVPALSCDKSGYRLGYGRGFYDRYFAQNDIPSRICLCYEMNIEDRLVKDKYDIASQIIVTENKVLRIF